MKNNRGGAGDGTFYDKTAKVWGFRAVRDGKDVRRKGFKTKTEAKEARILFLASYTDEKDSQQDEVPTVAEVFEHYIQHGSAEKREGTITKHSSLWKNHISPVFGSRKIDSISPGEVNNYLVQIYIKGSVFTQFEHGYAYGYVDGFLKFFYLLFGYSRRMGWISKEQYNELCNDKDSRITMPKKQDEDEDEAVIITYTVEEIQRMRERIKGSSLYLAFEIGYYMGLRISECFGLMWDDIDFKTKKMTIKRQMLKSGVHRVLVPCKTTTAKRVIDIPDALLVLLKEQKEKQEQNKVRYGTSYKATETVRVRMRAGQDEPLTSGSFIHRMEDGTLLSPDSMKSWSRNFKNQLGIHFKYHNLRHTHASTLAALNVPIPKLMERLGHKKISTTQKYYFGANSIADDRTIQALNSI